MKKIVGLDDPLLLIAEEGEGKPPTRREVLRMIGNIKADSGDDARRTRRLITRLRDKTATDLILENEDMNFLEKVFEKNAMSLTAWMQGQILEVIADAEKVEPIKPQVA